MALDEEICQNVAQALEYHASLNEALQAALSEFSDYKAVVARTKGEDTALMAAALNAESTLERVIGLYASGVVELEVLQGEVEALRE